MNKAFTVREMLSYGWETTKAHLAFALGTAFAYVAISMIGNNANKNAEGSLWALVVGPVSFIVTSLLQIGFMKAYFALHDGDKPDFNKSAAAAMRLFWRYIGTTILNVLIIMGGLMLLVIPGIYWAVKYQFATILVVDKGLRPMEALRRSAEMTKGRKWDLLSFMVVLVLINALGVLLAFVGLLVTLPVTLLAYIHLYRRFSEPVTETVPTPAAPSSGEAPQEPTIVA